MWALLEEITPDYVTLASDLLAFCGQVFAGGVLACFIAWAIGYAVQAVFGWLRSWTGISDDK